MAEHALPDSERDKGDITVNPSAPSINEAYVPDEELSEVATPPSAPTLFLEPHEVPLVIKPPELTEDEIRNACLKYVDKHRCYGSKFVKKMVIPQVLNQVVLHYRLESLGERRETRQKFTSYYGQSIDGPENGASPNPWEVEVRRPLEFKDSQCTVEVPHTAFVRQCNRCRGTGKITCSSCNGRGRKSCSSCHGSGRDRDDRRCSSCNGRGSRTCGTCSGTGKVRCPRCKGSGKLKWFTELMVTWTNHAEDFITDTAGLPQNRILRGQGDIVFQEEGVKVLPVCNAPDATANIASTQLVEKHGRGFPNEYTLKQRHWLRAVPFTIVRYGWKSKVGEFYIYGLENRVYFEKYPQPCCCCTCL